VTAHFTLGAYAITSAVEPEGGGSVICDPNPVDHGDDTTCTATANAGYSFTEWSGACTGTECELSGVSEPLGVTAHFRLAAYAITAGAEPAGSGTVTCDPSPVSHGGDSTCTAVAKAGYRFSHWSGACSGVTCGLTDVTEAQSVRAVFDRIRVTVPTPGDGGEATISVDGAGCDISTAVFVEAPAGAPADVTIPWGLADFTLTGCAGTATVTVTLPAAIPLGAGYWKEQDGVYTEFPATLTGNSATFVLTDNEPGDGDSTAGIIRDPSGVGLAAAPVPVFPPWVFALAACLLVLVGMRRAATASSSSSPPARRTSRRRSARSIR
jgi:hypothetical protein